MCTQIAIIASIGVAAALALSACSSSGGAGDSSNSLTSGAASTTSGSGKPVGRCKLTSPPQSAAKPPATTTPTLTATGKVGVILPDTTTSTRYTLFDKPLLQKSLSAAGLTPDIQNAGGSTAKFQQIAQSMIGDGVKVMLIDSIDATSGASVEKQAAAAGVKVIDYDRVNLGGTAPYYVSFDNEDVGKLQAQTLVDCLNADGVKKPSIIIENGGTDTDNNAVLFRQGAHAVLDPLVSAGKLTIAAEVVDKGWDPNTAGPTFSQALTSTGGRVDGVLAANDNIANSVISVLKQSGLNGHVVLTGQDSSVAGLQNILNGQQSMTVFKDVAKYEAGTASRLVIALAAGKSPAAAGLTLQPFVDPQSRSHKIQAVLLPATVVTQADVDAPITAGALTKSEVCQGIASACSAAGI